MKNSINIEKNGKAIIPNIVVNVNVNKFIGITKFSGFTIILNVNKVKPENTIFFKILNNNFI